MEIRMNLKTMTLAIALAFAAPVLAQSPGKTTTDPKDSNPAAPPATSAPSADRPASASGSSSTTTTAPAGASAGTGASGAPAAAGSSSAPVHSGTNAPDRPANTPKSETGAAAGSGAASGFSAMDRNNDGYISREEARDATWNNRFSELDKDNDGRISQSEFNTMGSSTTGGMGGSVGPGGTQSGSSTSGVGDKPGQKQ
jgi:EF hand